MAKKAAAKPAAKKAKKTTAKASSKGDDFRAKTADELNTQLASLKKELVHHEDYASRAQARASIVEYIEAFYNPKRRHSSLGYVSPAEYERAG